MLHFCPVSQHSPFVSLGVQDYVFLQLQWQLVPLTDMSEQDVSGSWTK